MLSLNSIGCLRIIRNIYYFSSFLVCIHVWIYECVCECLVSLCVVSEKLMSACKGQSVRRRCEVYYSYHLPHPSLVTVTLTVPRAKLEASKPQWPSCILVIHLHPSHPFKSLGLPVHTRVCTSNCLNRSYASNLGFSACTETTLSHWESSLALKFPEANFSLSMVAHL